MSQLTPFEVGQIKAHVHHGMSGAAISKVLRKPDGKALGQTLQSKMPSSSLRPNLVGEEGEKMVLGGQGKQPKHRIRRLCVGCSTAVAITRPQ